MGVVPLQLKILFAALGVAVIGILVWITQNAVTGSDETSFSKPEYVERLIPESGTEALAQSTVGVDLKEGYDAYLVINGVAIQNTASKDDEDGLRKAPTLG